MQEVQKLGVLEHWVQVELHGWQEPFTAVVELGHRDWQAPRYSTSGDGQDVQLEVVMEQVRHGEAHGVATPDILIYPKGTLLMH